MANKRKRRRQRQRAAAKQADNMKWNVYKVAARVAATGGPVSVFHVKEYDEDKLFELICSFMKVETVDDFDVLDIHLPRDDGKVEIIAELSEAWPRGAAVINVKGEIVRGVNDEPLQLISGAARETKARVSTPPKPSVFKLQRIVRSRSTVLMSAKVKQ